jgi:DNA-binding NtrC family response regulator
MKQSLNPDFPVLLVDDEKDFLNSIEFSLRSNKITNVRCCQDSRDVMPLLEKSKFSLILLDILMPHISGSELLPQIVEEYPQIPVIMVTAVDKVETAVECMKYGAFDYLVKPIETSYLIKTVRHTLDFMDVEKENVLLKERFFSDTLKNPRAFSEIVTKNREMHNIFKYIEAIAASNLPVLITGETGTGKELIARAIHKASGLQGNFISKKVGGLDNVEFSNELFGNESENRKGLVEQVKDGTLFLDEIGDISLQTQVSLLRLIQLRKYTPLGDETPLPTNIRLIVATYKDLKSMTETGQFRKDLYYRLQIHHIHLPTLRERKEDIPLLVDYFLEESANRLNIKKPHVPRELFTLLSNYDFPGNIRELGGMVVEAMTKHQPGTLSLDKFRERIRDQKRKIDFNSISNHIDSITPQEKKIAFADPFPTFKEMEEIYLKEALEQAKGDQKIAAKLTGLSGIAFSNRLKKIKEES